MTNRLAELDLRRWPPTSNRSLVAVDAADRLALEHVADHLVAGAAVLCVNDGFGALALSASLVGCSVTSWTDSVLAAEAVRRNADRNGVAAPTIVPATERPVGPFDVVIVKVPKNLTFLEAQLSELRPSLTEATTVVGAGMVKHLPRRATEVFDERIGPATTSLAKQKARLILADVDLGRTVEAPNPERYRTDDGIECVTWPNVFAHRKLDIGTRLLLDHLPDDGGADVVDLGCGNGVLGTALGRQTDVESVTFCDASWSAVASAEATWAANLPGDDRARFLAGDLAAGVDDASVDLVLLNPPFHDGHVVGDEPAHRMFDDARRVLRNGGELRVVANRHLGHHRQLKRTFGSVEVVASNPKFVVLSASLR